MSLKSSKNNRKHTAGTLVVAWLLSTIAFVVLKCLDVITWSWWWLLVPILGFPILAILAVGTMTVLIISLSTIDKPNKLL